MHVGATDSQRQCQSKYENLQLTVKGTTTQDPVLANWEITPTMAKAGDTVELYYYIYNPNTHSLDVTLGVSMQDSNGHEMVDEANDIDVTVTPGRNWYKRSFVIDANANSGYYDVMWGIHKAHLAGMYGDSGWQENSLEITTAKTLDDLLDAEQLFYDSAIRAVDGQTRQVVSDYVYFDRSFNFNVAQVALETLIKGGISAIPMSKVAELVSVMCSLHSILDPQFEGLQAEYAYGKVMSDDAVYANVLSRYREEHNSLLSPFYLTDTERSYQIKESHENFVNFLNNYDTTNIDQNELDIIIREQIN
ncbi:MAG: hypothetical protein U9P81_03015, partial [Euryarchaeota archaeon]|nr:hypothetical protein [Euryarchaeota archaeon]